MDRLCESVGSQLYFQPGDRMWDPMQGQVREPEPVAMQAAQRAYELSLQPSLVSQCWDRMSYAEKWGMGTAAA
jgi:hypothetical protein